MNLSVIIATFGAEAWTDLAWSRAYPSAVGQADDIVVVHRDTLARARNAGAETAKHRWLLFLDADDELAPGYVTAMRAAISTGVTVPPPLLTPRVQRVNRRGVPVGQPFFYPEVKPEDGNWLVIGTVLDRAMLWEVGGWEEWPIYEDWALFARMQKAGCAVRRVPGAVYRAFTVTTGRNHALGPKGKRQEHDRIRRAVFPELYEGAT